MKSQFDQKIKEIKEDSEHQHFIIKSEGSINFRDKLN